MSAPTTVRLVPVCPVRRAPTADGLVTPRRVPGLPADDPRRVPAVPDATAPPSGLGTGPDPTVPRAAARPVAEEDLDGLGPAVDVPRTAVGMNVDPHQASAMVALAAVEVLAGTRQQAQLARWLLPQVYDELTRRASLTQPRERLRSAPRAPRGAATAAASSPEMVGGTIAASGLRPVIRSLRMCRIDDDTVESSVVVGYAGRVRAVAVRLARLHGRWRASALVVG